LFKACIAKEGNCRASHYTNFSISKEWLSLILVKYCYAEHVSILIEEHDANREDVIYSY